METIRIQNGQTEHVEVLALDSSGNAVTGLSDVYLRIRRISDDYFLDFNDGQFKGSGWTNIETAMTEVDATNDPGKYSYNFNTSGFSDDTYEVRVNCTSANNFPQIGEVKVGDYVDYLDSEVSGVAASVWSYTTRTLTSFGNLISDVWSYTTRTLTSMVDVTQLKHSINRLEDLIERISKRGV